MRCGEAIEVTTTETRGSTLFTGYHRRLTLRRRALLGARRPLRSAQFRPEKPRQADTGGQDLEVGAATAADRLHYGELTHAQSEPIGPNNHFKIDGNTRLTGIHFEKGLLRKPFHTVQNILDDGAPLAPAERRKHRQRSDAPFAWPQEMVVLLIPRALYQAARHYHLIAGQQQELHLLHDGGVKSAFWKEHDYVFTRGGFNCLPVSGIQAAPNL